MAKLRVVAEIEPQGNFPVVSAPNVAVGNSTLDSVVSGLNSNLDSKPNVYLQASQPSNLKSGDIWFEIIQ